MTNYQKIIAIVAFANELKERMYFYESTSAKTSPSPEDFEELINKTFITIKELVEK